MSISKLKKDLKRLANARKAKLLQGFFKTGKGEYGEGDIFLGVMVPDSRKIAVKYRDLSFSDVGKLLNSKIHEERLVAILLLVHKFQIGERKKVYDFYLRNTKKVNNWDLVDLSCHKIIGEYLIDKNRSVLYKLAKSSNLWERRISIISCFAFIRDNDFKDAIKLSNILLNDEHDLMHKAVGWVLREIGKKNKKVLVKFLDKNCKKMPRTMLRYSLEKFSEKERKKYMKK